MGKIVIDPYNEVVIQKGFRHIVVDSGLNYGGYGIKETIPAVATTRKADSNTLRR